MSRFLQNLIEANKLYRCKGCGRISKKRVNCMTCGSFKFEELDDYLKREGILDKNNQIKRNVGVEDTAEVKKSE